MIAAILVVIFYSNGSGMFKSVAMQEFSSIHQCEYAKALVMKRADLKDAFCVNK